MTLCFQLQFILLVCLSFVLLNTSCSMFCSVCMHEMMYVLNAIYCNFGKHTSDDRKDLVKDWWHGNLFSKLFVWNISAGRWSVILQDCRPLFKTWSSRVISSKPPGRSNAELLINRKSWTSKCRGYIGYYLWCILDIHLERINQQFASESPKKVLTMVCTWVANAIFFSYS